MRSLASILLFILYMISILIGHIFVINFLPYPYNHLHVIFGILALSLSIGTNRKIILLALCTSYIAELFGSTPFGLNTLSLLLSLLMMHWLQFNIFSNRSFYMIFFSTLMGMSLYRGIFLASLTVNNYFLGLENLPYKEIIVDAGWEVLLTSIFTFVVYALYIKLAGRSRFSARKTSIYYGKTF